MFVSVNINKFMSLRIKNTANLRSLKDSAYAVTQTLFSVLKMR